jgi:hypothetical protein
VKQLAELLAKLIVDYDSTHYRYPVLSGKREPSKAHIREMPEFFNVSADLFL